MADRRSTHIDHGSKANPSRHWLLAVVGLALVALSHPLVWGCQRAEMLFAPLGIGLALSAWLGLGVVPLVAAVLMAVQVQFRREDTSSFQAVLDALLVGLEISASWWCYRKAGGTRRLDDPRSTTMFLLMVPLAFGGIFSFLLAFNQTGFRSWDTFWPSLLGIWIDQVLGILAVTPPLLAAATPWLVHYRLAQTDPGEPRFVVHPRLTWTFGDLLETGALAIGAGVLGVVLAFLYAKNQPAPWHWWGVLLLINVWASLRLGLRGGSLVAGSATIVALLFASYLTDNPELLAPMRGNLLAQCSTAMLIGASADWIRASEARYRQVVGHIPVVLYSGRFLRAPKHGATPEVEILFVSPAASHVLGCEPDSLLGDFRAWVERINPQDRELVWASLAQLMLQKQPVTCEYRLADVPSPKSEEKESDNERPVSDPIINLNRHIAPVPQRFVRDTLALHYGADGQLDGWEGVVEDITEQRLLSQNLRRTTNMLQGLVAHLPTGVYFVHGPNGRPLLVNARARQLLGQREDFAAGLSHLSSIYRLHRPDGTPYPWEELPVSKALREGATCMRDDIVVHRLDGRRVPLVTWAAPVDLGGHGGTDAAVWVLEDLTALRQSEDRYRGLIESLPLMLLQFDQHGALTYHNPAAEEITGYKGNCLRESGFWQQCFDADELQSFNGLLEAARAGKSTRAEFRYRAADGSERVGYALSQPHRPNGAMVLVVDMTQRRRLEQEMQNVQRLELVGRIASGVVHDFNNLLTVIIGHAELAQGAIGQHPVKSDLDRILHATDQAQRLAGQLLTFSKQRQVVLRPVDFHAITKHTLEILKPALPAMIDVQMLGREDEAIVLGDETPLQQVVMNLCLNARDAMPEGGQLLVETACESAPGQYDEGAEKISTNGKYGWVRLSVTDTGHGMDDSVMARIFEPLFTTKDHGSGLGLAVVKQIVEGFSGRIHVRSTPGQGTRFDVWLPLRSN